MRLNRPQGVATDRVPTARVARRRLGAGAIRLLSVTTVAAATCALWAGAASAATAAPAAGTTTTTTITNANPGTVDAGDAFTFHVTVTGAGGTPTGTVAIVPTDPTDLPTSYSCTVTLADGAGSCAVTPGAGTFGDVDYTATYSGDGTFAGSASGTYELAVPESTTTTVSPATATAGAVTLTATVVGEAKGNISPSAGGSGTVTFYNGETVISTACAAAPLTYDGGGGNLATCKTTLAAGSYTITAKYSGDLNNLASSGAETLVVKGSTPPTKHATKTNGSAKPGSTKIDRVVTLRSTVTSSSGTPTGRVTFKWRGHVVCSARLSHGKAHCSIIFLKAGKYRIRAWYSGDSTHNTSHSAFFEVTIKK
jgi:hypothetical protein